MSIVTGIGAIMIYANNPVALAAWYNRILGIQTTLNHSDQCHYGSLKDNRASIAIPFGIYPAKQKLSEDNHAIMLNFRIDRFDELLGTLASNDVLLEGSILEEPYGRFAYIRDPEGNPIELFTDQPKHS
jgi:catechol-2,3-dioxygenase